MNWRASKRKQKAVSDSGYSISWAVNGNGIWFNAYSPDSKHLAAGYDDAGRDHCKAVCEAHAANPPPSPQPEANASADASQRIGDV